MDIVVDIVDNHFNPRLREGGDLASYANTLVISGFQSTPPRRRRLQIPGAHIAFVDFNPRLREGGDKISNFSRYLKKGFQSTPPRRRRLIRVRNPETGRNISIHASAKEATARAILDALTAQNFNPRLREGGDKFPGKIMPRII